MTRQFLISRRRFTETAAALTLGCGKAEKRRPNILFAIADDHSWLHTSAAGDPVVRTPAIDRVARSGVLFRQAYTNAPACAPSRAAILTGRPCWSLEEAGSHASYFPRKLTVYPDLLASAGYHVGLTAKGAGPCNWKDAGWANNPAGPSFDARKLAKPLEGIDPIDYAANFADFLHARQEDRPFCFWYGGTEPHRKYKKGAGLESGKKLDDVVVPPFLPDTSEVRSDILDYYTEIEHFDSHLGRMLDLLEKEGGLANTIVVVTGDNGMPFPRAKGNMYEYGIHMPLAIAWPGESKGGRTCDDIISFLDFAPTFLDAAGLRPSPEMRGRSLLPLLRSGRSGVVDPRRTRAFSGRERHSHARFDNLSYPSRSLRTGPYLYVWNAKPDRWPLGDPPGFHDVDDGPTKKLVIDGREDPKIKPFFDAAFCKRPEEELYDVRKDPACLRNLATDRAMESVRTRLRNELREFLKETNDPRVLGYGDIWESYPRFNNMRPELGGFAEFGKYNPKYQKTT